jgi:hypothetical protein
MTHNVELRGRHWTPFCVGGVSRREGRLAQFPKIIGDGRYIATSLFLVLPGGCKPPSFFLPVLGKTTMRWKGAGFISDWNEGTQTLTPRNRKSSSHLPVILSRLDLQVKQEKIQQNTYEREAT